MATYMKYGYSYGPRVVVTARVADTGTIDDGDIVVLDAVGGATGAGYIKKWSTASDPVVGVALERVDPKPDADGDASIQIVLAMPGSVFVYPAQDVAQGHCFQTCDINGAQSVNVAADTYKNAWIVEVDEEMGLAYVMLKGPFSESDAGSDIDYGAAGA
jgi:hypothetical protein